MGGLSLVMKLLMLFVQPKIRWTITYGVCFRTMQCAITHNGWTLQRGSSRRVCHQLGYSVTKLWRENHQNTSNFLWLSCQFFQFIPGCSWTVKRKCKWFHQKTVELDIEICITQMDHLKYWILIGLINYIMNNRSIYYFNLYGTSVSI